MTLDGLCFVNFPFLRFVLMIVQQFVQLKVVYHLDREKFWIEILESDDSMDIGL